MVGQGRSFKAAGVLVGNILPAGVAIRCQRALGASGVAGGTDERAQFHYRLIVAAGVGFEKQQVCEYLKIRMGCAVCRGFQEKETRENAFDVAVHDGKGLVKSDAQDGSGNIWADTRQALQGLRVMRQVSIHLRCYDPGGLVQVASPGIVAQAFPYFVNRLEFGYGQASGIRELSQKTLIIGDDGFYLGLLQHCFGDPYGVRVAGLSPGKVPLIVVVPGVK